MGAYNRTDGEPCCASRKLMEDILLGQWKCDGYYVSDCGAIRDISENHHFTDTLPEAATLALKTGCNLNCGEVYVHLMEAYEQDLITEEAIAKAAEKLTYHVKAIIHGWYPGAVGGLAAARLLAGKYSPSGKLPLTFYKNDTVLPEITEYAMDGRTYRYFTGTPLYPFGYGLSYTSFAYSDVQLAGETDETYEISCTLTNTGSMEGSEKVQVYASYTDSRTPTPLCQLCGLACVKLGAGESSSVSVKVDKYWVKAVFADGSRAVPDGEIVLHVGGHQPDAVSCALLGNEPAKLTIQK